MFSVERIVSDPDVSSSNQFDKSDRLIGPDTTLHKCLSGQILINLHPFDRKESKEKLATARKRRNLKMLIILT
jgi:hypothetical protein